MKVLIVVLFFIPFSLSGQECVTANICVPPGANICTGCCDGKTINVTVWNSSNGTCTGGINFVTALNCTGSFTFSSDVSITSTPCALSIEDIDANRISFYPNPSSGMVYLKHPKGENLSVFNMIGQEVYKTKLDTSLDIQKLDLSNLRSGVYFVRINEGNNVTTKHLILK